MEALLISRSRLAGIFRLALVAAIVIVLAPASLRAAGITYQATAVPFGFEDISGTGTSAGVPGDGLFVAI